MTDPLALLRADRASAAAKGDPNSALCVLATVAGGEPQARTLVLREIEAPGGGARLGLFLNRTSAKHGQLRESNAVAVLVYLPSLRTQYRLTAALKPVPAAIVAAHWRLRPAVAQRMDWAYGQLAQGAPLANRAELEALLRAPCPDTPPETALGYYLAPTDVDRLVLDQADGPHERRRFRLAADGWLEQPLVP